MSDIARQFAVADAVLPIAMLQSVSSPTSIGADQTAWDVGTGSAILATSSAAYSIGGFANPVGGRSFKVFNNGSYVLRIKHQDSTATAANRIICPHGLDWPLAPGECFEFWYDSTNSRFRLIDGWQQVLKNPQYGMEFVDDFFTGSTAIIASGIVNWGGSISGNGLIQGNASGNNNGYGFAKINCDDVTSYARLTSPFITRIRHGFLFETQLRVETLSTGSERANYIIGMCTPAATTITPTDGIYFYYDLSVSANIYCGTSASGVQTVTDSTVAVSTSFQVLKWVLNSAHDSVGFYVNGTLVATHTTNIPTAATAIHPFVLYLKALGSATFNSIFLDSWRLIRVDYSARY